MKFDKIARELNRFVQRHGSKILTGLGIGGFVTAGVLAVRATPEALDNIHQMKEQKSLDSEETVTELAPKEIVQCTWKLYLPAAITGLVSAACVIGANAMTTHQVAVLSTAYAVTDTAYKEYRAKTKEVVGDKKAQEIDDGIAKDKLDRYSGEPVEIYTRPKHTTLCLEAFTGRYFMSDMEELRQIENRLNRRMLDDMQISLNDFYDEIDLPHTKVGNDLGWNIKDGLMDFVFSSQLNEHGEPCIVIDSYLSPNFDYEHSW